uniref:Uncharacterized protein n=1 Tax=Anopheles melas TaxID=34690 RepID=A0A182U9N7_9DIPT
MHCKTFIFDGTDFERWKAWMTLHLASQGMLQCIQHEPEALLERYVLAADRWIELDMQQMVLHAFRLLDLKCTNVLIQNMAVSQCAKLNHRQTACQIWKALTRQYDDDAL